MRALALLILCVMLLAVLQASYIVAEAKKHSDMGEAMASEREHKHGKRKHNGDSSEMAVAGEDIHDKMMVEPPHTDTDDASPHRAGRRERTMTKEERRALKEQRKADRKAERKAERKDQKVSDKDQRKEERKEDKVQRREERKEKKMERQNKKEMRNQKKMDKQTKKEERKARKAARKENKDQRVTCVDDSECQEDECCTPSKSGDMICKANKKPKLAGKKCLTSCSCEGDYQCFVKAEGKSRRRPIGRCTKEADADLTNGFFITPQTFKSPKA